MSTNNNKSGNIGCISHPHHQHHHHQPIQHDHHHPHHQYHHHPHHRLQDESEDKHCCGNANPYRQQHSVVDIGGGGLAPFRPPSPSPSYSTLTNPSHRHYPPPHYCHRDDNDPPTLQPYPGSASTFLQNIRSGNSNSDTGSATAFLQNIRSSQGSRLRSISSSNKDGKRYYDNNKNRITSSLASMYATNRSRLMTTGHQRDSNVYRDNNDDDVNDRAESRLLRTDNYDLSRRGRTYTNDDGSNYDNRKRHMAHHHHVGDYAREGRIEDEVDVNNVTNNNNNCGFRGNYNLVSVSTSSALMMDNENIRVKGGEDDYNQHRDERRRYIGTTTTTSTTTYSGQQQQQKKLQQQQQQSSTHRQQLERRNLDNNKRGGGGRRNNNMNNNNNNKDDNVYIICEANNDSNSNNKRRYNAHDDDDYCDGNPHHGYLPHPHPHQQEQLEWAQPTVPPSYPHHHHDHHDHHQEHYSHRHYQAGGNSHDGHGANVTATANSFTRFWK